MGKFHAFTIKKTDLYLFRNLDKSNYIASDNYGKCNHYSKCNLWQVWLMASVTYGKNIMANETEP